MPKDLANIVLDYLYRPNIASLNTEYREKFVYIHDTNREYLHYKPKDITVNSVNLIYRDIIISFISGKIYFFILEKYKYSSGYNNLSGFFDIFKI